jgi:hypothetical protein
VIVVGDTPRHEHALENLYNSVQELQYPGTRVSNESNLLRRLIAVRDSVAVARTSVIVVVYDEVMVLVTSVILILACEVP